MRPKASALSTAAARRAARRQLDLCGAATEPARWICVHWAVLQPDDALDKKRAELMALKFDVEPPTNPDHRSWACHWRPSTARRLAMRGARPP
jgi:hypothetical protein